MEVELLEGKAHRCLAFVGPIGCDHVECGTLEGTGQGGYVVEEEGHQGVIFLHIQAYIEEAQIIGRPLHCEEVQ